MRSVREAVLEGGIPPDRIDDAVTRILRVKMRAGLWDKPSPAARRYAGAENLLGLDSHRAHPPLEVGHIGQAVQDWLQSSVRLQKQLCAPLHPVSHEEEASARTNETSEIEICNQ